MSFINKLKSEFSTVIGKVKAAQTALAKVIKTNNSVLEEETKLAKSNKLAINVFKDYAQKETPAIGKAVDAIIGALETIQSNREAFVAQVKYQFITPLNDVNQQWLVLQEQIDEEDKAQKRITKAQKELAKKQAKPQEKQKPGEIDDAGKELQEATKAAETIHETVIKATAEFNDKKNKILAEVLNALVERHQAFHEQATNIINDAVDTMKTIDFKKEN
jgi:hypothetical protein